ncbi:hypothetical protein LTR84_008337 [Exophiala bonariae]|uniref:Major facilitator superfamily (MFS) profile domain-containing protein n=1 Tax=Exophiala bonariae TaxID=1690606 RepID=A0AAV9MY54_9EURO|nr:hypothetical protein LTR84_008337 [Exophiala bonariae]
MAIDEKAADCVETVDPKTTTVATASEELDDRHVPLRLIIITAAVTTAYLAIIVHIVGSGLLSRSIVASIGGSDKIAWLTIVVTLHPILLGPPVAQAADLWGRKWFIVAAMFAGTIGCLIVSRANTIGVAIAGQAIAGFNQSAQGLTHAIVSEILPRRYRPWAQAGIHVASGFGALIGLYGGGALCRTSPEGFRSYWYLTAGIFFAVGCILTLLYNPPARELQHLTLREKVRRFDLPGVFLLITSMLGICLGLGWSQNPYGWGNAHILVPFIIGIIGLVVLVTYYISFKKDGIVNRGLFRGSRNFPIALVCLFAEGVSFFAANNYFGFQVGLLFDRDLLLSGATYSITWISYMIATSIAGWYCSRTATLKVPVILAFAAFVLFFGLMISVRLASGTEVWGYGVFLGIGLGVSLNALVVVAQLSIPPELIATGTSLMLAIRAAGGTVGLAIYNAVFNAALSDNLGSKISQAALSHGLPRASLPHLIESLAHEDYAAVQSTPGVTPEIIRASVIALKEAFNVGFRNVYITSLAAASVALLASLFLQDRQDEFTFSIDAPVIETKAKDMHE